MIENRLAERLWGAIRDLAEGRPAAPAPGAHGAVRNAAGEKGGQADLTQEMIDQIVEAEDVDLAIGAVAANLMEAGRAYQEVLVTIATGLARVLRRSGSFCVRRFVWGFDRAAKKGKTVVALVKIRGVEAKVVASRAVAEGESFLAAAGRLYEESGQSGQSAQCCQSHATGGHPEDRHGRDPASVVYREAKDPGEQRCEAPKTNLEDLEARARRGAGGTK